MQDHLHVVLGKRALDCMVLDGAGEHRCTRLRDLATRRVLLPYVPKLNLAERTFQEVRRAVEGSVDGPRDLVARWVLGYLRSPLQEDSSTWAARRVPGDEPSLRVALRILVRPIPCRVVTSRVEDTYSSFSAPLHSRPATRLAVIGRERPPQPFRVVA